MPWKAIATTTLMDALVNVLAAVILQRIPASGTQWRMQNKNLKEMILGNWGAASPFPEICRMLPPELPYLKDRC